MPIAMLRILIFVHTVASTVLIQPQPRAPGIVSVTPHQQYSSSIGVLGCKINVDRVAYWPGDVDCNEICVEVSYGGRSVRLLKIDSSGGAHDVSYDAWNYLVFGQSAAVEPHQGGGVEMTWESRPASECGGLLDQGKYVPLTAANSMNFVASCLQRPDSYVANNYKLYNVLDPVCHWGTDEECSLDLSISNQPLCPSGLGSNKPLDLPIWNIEYGTGTRIRG